MAWEGLLVPQEDLECLDYSRKLEIFHLYVHDFLVCNNVAHSFNEQHLL